MKLNKLCSAFALILTASVFTACGGDEDCPDGQAMANIRNVTACYVQCSGTDASNCAVGETCDSNFCVPPASGNNQNNNNDNNSNNSNNENNSNNNSNNGNNTNNNSNNQNNTNNSNNSNNGTNNGNCVPSTLAGACDTLCQTGCADNTTCIAGNISGNVTQACVPVGDVAEGGTCSAQALCQEGLGCLATEQNGPMTCRKYCRLSGGEPECGANQVCGQVQGLTDIGICADRSNDCTRVPDSCTDANEKCGVTQIGDQCVPHAGGASGAACTPPNAMSTSLPCGKDLVCIGAQGQATTCRDLCDPNNPQCTNSSCQAVSIQDQNGMVVATINVCI